MSDLRNGFDAGRSKTKQVIREYGFLSDPVGLDSQRPKLRSLGKWRFILIRGIVGFGVPCFLWIVLREFSRDVDFAHRFHQPVITYLLHEWLFMLCMSALMGFVVDLLAWRRISETWPGEPPDREAPTTTLGL